MNDSTYAIIVIVFIVFFFVIQLSQEIVQKIKYRNRYSLYYKHKVIWKKRLISVLISFLLTLIAVVFLMDKNYPIIDLELSSEGIFVSLSTILICSLAFVYGNRRGENLTRGLKPIIRENPLTSLFYYPYRTLRQSYKFPSYGRYPSDFEALQWREETRNFASGRAMWLVMYVLYLIVLIEGFVIMIFFSHDLSMNIPNLLDFVKLIGMILTAGFLFFSLMLMIIHIPIIWTIETVARLLRLGESRLIEWSKILLHSLLFYVFMIGFIKIVIYLG